MVNRTVSETRRLPAVARWVTAYTGVVVATLAALAVLAAVRPQSATGDAWVHAVVVAAFAVLLLLRLRSARHGSPRALRAVGVIAVVLVVANLVEAAVPGLFPGWMRVEMLGIAAIMAVVAAQSLRPSRQPRF